MRDLFLLILLSFSVVEISSRPSQRNQNNEGDEEIEYESDVSPADDNLEDSRFGDEDPTGQEPNLEQNRRLLDLHRNTYLQKNVAEDTGPRTNEVPDYKAARTREVRNDENRDVPNDALNSNDEFQSCGKRRQFSKYIENTDATDQSEVAQHLTNRDVNNFKTNRMHNNMILDNPLNKRTIESKTASTEEGDLLFGNGRGQMNNVDKNDYINNDLPDLNQRSSNYQIESDNNIILDANSHDYLNYNRDRRETKEFNQEESESVKSSNEGLDKNTNENEEMAIKRHIKKMSGVELEQLLNSLSEEKRALLKKIIDDVDASEKTYDTINKREITKKAGAVEDDRFMESGQSEASKVQSDVSSLDITTAFPVAQNTETTETNKQNEGQPDSAMQTNQKSDTNPGGGSAELNTNINSESEKSDISFVVNNDANKNPAEVVANEQVTFKNENKREASADPVADATSIDDFKMSNSEYQSKESRNDETYLIPQDEDLSQFLDDIDQTRFEDNSKIHKRDVDKQSELDAKLKSLEESFPNSDAYDDSAPYSGPLIRVKRKNDLSMKKRSAAVLPDAKVGFFPYKAENDDDDTDEGNEFDDDGFYDPTPNFVSSENKNVDSNSQQMERDDVSCKLNNVDQSKSPITVANGDVMSLGSDTDNVLSGVEGVDENLMFSSGTRNRRKTEGNVENIEDNQLISAHGKATDIEAKANANNNLNIPNYQENDSFGGLPRNYEGDLGRYKRIRRVKQSHSSEESSA